MPRGVLRSSASLDSLLARYRVREASRQQASLPPPPDPSPGQSQSFESLRLLSFRAAEGLPDDVDGHGTCRFSGQVIGFRCRPWSDSSSAQAFLKTTVELLRTDSRALAIRDFK